MLDLLTFVPISGDGRRIGDHASSLRTLPMLIDTLLIASTGTVSWSAGRERYKILPRGWRGCVDVRR